MNLLVRDATQSDLDAIVRGNALMAQETEGKPLDESLLGAGVAAVLEDSNHGRYWVACVDGQVVGQIMVTHEWSDWRNGVMWWIQSVYVNSDYRRKGVFSALYRHIEAMARESGDCAGIRLYVEEENRRAQATYAALGMKDAGYKVMEVDFGMSYGRKGGKPKRNNNA